MGERAAATETQAEELAALVRRARAGEAAAFGQLAERFARVVYAVALAHLGRRADAEDVAQSVLLAALENLETCRDPERFDAWILAIARNRARRALVRRRLRDVLARPPEDWADPTDHAKGFEERRLLEALSLLTPEQREVVLLHDLEGHTHPEVARLLGISEEASRQQLSRARKRLRAHWEGQTP